MMHSNFILILVIGVACLGNQSEAQTPRQSLTSSIENASRGDTTKYDISSVLTYSLRHDLAQPREPKSAQHRLQANGAITIFDRPVMKGFDDEFANEVATFSLVVAGQMSTIAGEIDATRGNGVAELSDVDFSVARAFPLNPVFSARNSVDASLGFSLPTSLVSQYESIKAVAYASVGWSLLFQGGRYGLMQTLSGDYIMNEYDYSPVTREVNPRSSLGYSLAGTVRLGGGFRLKVGGNARIVNSLDGTNTSVLSNSQSLSWTDGKNSIAATYSNGARAEDRETSMWFVDEYRRVISLAFSVRF
jgi:hypothetical protein